MRLELVARRAVPFVLSLVGILATEMVVAQDTESEAPTDVLEEFDIAVTTGAAPDYVADETCAMCHDDIVESYAEVAMSKSFYRPSAEKAIETFERFFHERSQRYVSLPDDERQAEPEGDHFGDHASNQRGGNCQPVGQRVEELADLRDLVELASQDTVQPIGPADHQGQDAGRHGIVASKQKPPEHADPGQAQG